MLWPQAASSARPLPASPDASAEALRVATLQASWARDRQVARRRLAWRWLLWAWWRYLLPVGLVLGIAAWLAIWLIPETNRLLAQRLAEKPMAGNAPASPYPSAPVSHAPDLTLTPEGEPLDIGRPDQDPLVLRFDLAWGAQPGPDLAPKPATADDSPTLPPLFSENWLHSKEP
jgi:hypothetical protein